MDWANERYVRLYTRDTGDWAMWPWQTRSLFCLILRKVDRAGIISCGKGKLRALSRVIDMPEAEIAIAMEPLIEDGCIQFNDDGDLIVANFIEAQEVLSTPAARQRDSRERRRDMVRRGLRPEQRECAIYFIQPENGGSIKIGRAEDVAKRLVQLQTSRPDKLVVIAAAAGTYEDEKRLHEAFAPLRDRGEWFCASEGLTSLVCHINETGLIPCDLSQFVTSHSDPIRAVPSQTEPSQTEPCRAASDTAAPSEVPRASERRLKSVPPPAPFEPTDRSRIEDAIRAQPKLADLDIGDLSGFAATRIVTKGTKFEWVLQAIEDAAEKSQRGEQSHVRHSRVIGFIKHAKGPKRDEREAKGGPAYSEFKFDPGEVRAARRAVPVRPKPADSSEPVSAEAKAAYSASLRGVGLGGMGPPPQTEQQLRDKASSDIRRLEEQERKVGGT